MAHHYLYLPAIIQPGTTTQRTRQVGSLLRLLKQRAQLILISLTIKERSKQQAHLNIFGLCKLVISHQLNLAFVRVRLQVVSRPVRQPYALHPTMRALDLCVPAICSVVRHLVLQMLPEAEAGAVDAESSEEEIGSADEVAQRLIVDDSLKTNKA